MKRRRRGKNVEERIFERGDDMSEGVSGEKGSSMWGMKNR